ncbi:putative carbohydrate kinase PfkB family protein [Flavihumibacter petaseus NBRC 106054]|uniref:Putative carbohydrate kinase PfkB family protein n=2 Tax=Flavihumibacter TaxID=1004301 RepID=A0A0E9N4U1_9BACT|nr:putative carbohydrate kinase PfkB family protein [Flavihumibacter petaseus NBRC 106054]
MSPAFELTWLQTNDMPVYLGGAELNVAMALKHWDIPVRYISAVPANGMGKSVAAYVAQSGIDTTSMIFSGNRVGVYYLPQGTDLRHAGVIYDRAHSSFSQLQPGSIDWGRALEGVDWFHFSAISPPLSDNVNALCLEALRAAEKKNITISVDLNYREMLWANRPDPRTVLPELVSYCHVVMGNIWSADKLLGIPNDNSGQAHTDAAQWAEIATGAAAGIFAAFPKVHTVANTFRFDQERGLCYFACLDQKVSRAISPVFRATTIVDRVGSGDCFMAGLIRGIKAGASPEAIVSFAAAAAFGKLQEKGDSTRQTIEQIKKIQQQYA